MRRQLPVDAVEVAYGEFLLVGRLRVVAVGNIDNILFYVFLHHKPWSASEAHALALTDGVEPVATVLAYQFARLQFNDIARQFA